jgi:hypothetical protein
MLKIEQYGYVEDGLLKILNRKRMDAEIKAFPNCDVEIIIKKKGKRSGPQNRYYFGVVLKEIQLRLRELGTETDIETLHEWCKQKFNSEKIVVPETAELIEIGKTTTELNKEEFSEYVERIVEWAASSLCIYIPPPNTQTNLFAA